jgi:hypothetical protein
VQCDESIMAIIRKIDTDHNHTFITERLDDETCLVQASKLTELKMRLKEVCNYTSHIFSNDYFSCSRTPSKRRKIQGPTSCLGMSLVSLES